jgi:hypothetical protein
MSTVNIDAYEQLRQPEPAPLRCGEATTFTLRDLAECVLEDVVEHGEATAPVPTTLSAADCDR